jgi:hypothetical protein
MYRRVHRFAQLLRNPSQIAHLSRHSSFVIFYKNIRTLRTRPATGWRALLNTTGSNSTASKKVGAQLELSKPAPQMAGNDRPAAIWLC